MTEIRMPKVLVSHHRGDTCIRVQEEELYEQPGFSYMGHCQKIFFFTFGGP